MGEDRGKYKVINEQERFKDVFKKDAKIEEKRKKLDIKMDEVFQQKTDIAFEFYVEFLNSNKEFNKNSEYFTIYIESGYFLAEELIFTERFNDFVKFTHRSIPRQNQPVNLYFNVEQSDYTTNSVVIDKKQYDRLFKEFRIIIRS